ncbi:winged helix-turn-helix domain-containing protein [Nocardioides coralli]|uniref:winged helix-turn-helix domain-containing protein n=1 Tax=Nocardioides coralli TaxID=2872154 RepID=UPI001CA39BB4|nr:crosslink repair DNA glycosylase YcaQ family protein [Nocardioides coralli]QZY30029.1 winged helix DNA-binding domain-containing protein [Nocardioides coralli]
MIELSKAEARRVALAAQGFLDPPHAVPTLRTLARTLERTSVLQVDSVNVLARAHLMPLYSRMGPYDPALLERAASGRERRRLVEYWAHVQALMPVDLWPAMQFRRDHYRAQRGKWGFTADARLEPAVLQAVRDRGPVTARQLDAEFSGPRTREHWGWNWSDARQVLDYLYLVGDVAIAGRSPQFEVRYDVPERVLPRRVLEAPTPSPQESARALVRRAARSHGVGSGPCLADYFRMRWQPGNGEANAREAVADLVEAGELEEVRVEGWRRPAWLHASARRPRSVRARALLSPFDPLVWERTRTETLFDFHYRIEIYVPRPQRRFGYYVLPFLLGERIVARVDLKADRATGRLLVPAAFAEQHAPEETAAQLAAELRSLAGWLGLDEVEVGSRGDLAAALASELSTVSDLTPPAG